ncbi:MAG: DUF4347 domain-containing protein [Pedobacter sp.]|nr:DUF4347 domain-containing protein [Pedobacter sp.]
MSKHSSNGHKNQSVSKKAEGLSRYMALEPRVLLDAAAVATAGKLVDQVQYDASTSDATSQNDALIDHLSSLYQGEQASALAGSASPAKELLFVDANIDGYEALIAGLGSNIEVHTLQGQGWSAQMKSVLEQHQGDIAAVHLVSHGTAGELRLAGSSITSTNLDAYAPLWAAMKQSLTQDGDLLIYGCDVAAGDSGTAFIQALSERTGADVAASVNASGSTAAGGDWMLEAHYGLVAARSVYEDTSAGTYFQGLLDTQVGTTGWFLNDAPASTAAANSVAFTKTTADNREWMFVSDATNARVDVYLRNTDFNNNNAAIKSGAGLGEWVYWESMVGDDGVAGGSNGTGNFGFDIAAAGNKLAVAAPLYDPSTSNARDGRVYVYTYDSVTKSWTVDANIQKIDGNSITPTDSDDDGTDQFGYSVDIAYDGNSSGTGAYRLVVGNPYEDWDTWLAGNSNNAGVAVVFSSASGGNFSTQVYLSSRDTGLTDEGGGNLFGTSVAVTYAGGAWWVAAGASSLDKVYVYKNPGTSYGQVGTTGLNFGWTGSGPNAISMDQDFMAISNDANIKIYKLSGTTSNYWVDQTGNTVTLAAGANAVVSIVDKDHVATASASAGVANATARLLYSDGTGTKIVDIATGSTAANGTNTAVVTLNTTRETAVALDKTRFRDVVVAGASGTGTGVYSWYYNPAPTVSLSNDVLAVNEDASASVNVWTNDNFGSATSGTDAAGDVYNVAAVSQSIYGATISRSGGTITYNTTTSAYLNTLRQGQVVSETLTVTLHDGLGTAFTTQVTVTITGVNDAPVVTSLKPVIPFASQQAGSTVTYDFSSYFTDVDQGEAALLTPIIVFGANTTGWSVTATGTLVNITIPAGAANASQGTLTISYKDPSGVSASDTSPTRNFLIQVDASNDAPVKNITIAGQVAIANYDYRLALPSNTFVDYDPAPFDTLTYSATLVGGGALPAWLQFDPVTREFLGKPTAAGSYSVRVAVSDGRGGTASQDFTLDVVDPTLKTVAALSPDQTNLNNANYGFSVAISNDGQWMAVGAPGLSLSGEALPVTNGTVSIFQMQAGTWTFRTTLTGAALNDQFGYSVAWDDMGSTLVVGARTADVGATVDAGAVYVYTRTGTTFSTATKFIANSANAKDYFGTSVALSSDGSYVLIGASNYDISTDLVDAGAAFYVQRSLATAAGYGVTANVLAGDPVAYDKFGSSVAFDQQIMIVASMGDDNPSGIMANWSLNETGGTAAVDFIGGSTGVLKTGAQFIYDSVRGQVLRLDATVDTGAALSLSTPVDLGATWSISAWYKDIPTNNLHRTLTRGSTGADGADGNHQIIINNNSSNQLGAWNNSGKGATEFIAANTKEEQILVVSASATTATGSITLTIPGLGSTATIPFSTSAVTLAGSIQSALNTAFGSGFATVTSIDDGALGDVFRVSLNTTTSYDLFTVSTTNTSGTLTAAVGREVQKLDITQNSTASLTLTIPGLTGTVAATYNATAANQASNIQSALNTALSGLGYSQSARVLARSEGTASVDGFYILFAGDFATAGNDTTRLITSSKTATTTLYKGANSAYSLTAAQLSGWHNIVAVADGSGINARTSYYIDGIKVGTAYFKPTDDVSTIGNFQGGGQQFSNYIDDVQIYERALSATEIASLKSGNALAQRAAGDAGSVYVFSTATGLPQMAKLYVPDGISSDQLGWDIDIDIYNGASTNQNGIIVASSIYNSTASTNGGAVYVWTSDSLQAGGKGEWKLSYTLTAFDSAPGGYFGNGVAVDYDERSAASGGGGARIVVGAPFDAANGDYSGAAYAFKYQSGAWLPEKFVDVSPSGGTIATAALFGNAVDVAQTTAVFGSRWKDTNATTAIRDGAVFSVNLLTNGNYQTISPMSIVASQSMVVTSIPSLMMMSLDSSETMGNLSIDENGVLLYSPGEAFSTLAYGETAEDTFVYYTEVGGSIYENRVNVTVLGQYEQAATARNDVVQVSAAQASVLDVLANDLAGSGLILVGVESADLTGALTYDDSYVYYDPQGAYDSLKAGEVAHQTFTYTAQDAAGNRVTGLVSLEIIGINDPVMARDDNAIVSADAEQLVINVLANDSDRDGQGTFWIMAVDTSALQGTLEFTATGEISYSPGDAFNKLPVGQSIEERVVYIVRDESGNQSSAQLIITVEGKYAGPSGEGELPVARDDVAVTSGVMQVHIPVSANDGGGQIDSVSTAGTVGTVMLTESGDLLYTPGSAMAQLPSGQVRVDSFTYTVRYDDGRVSTATVRVHVNGTYVAPFVYMAPESIVDAEDDALVNDSLVSVVLPQPLVAMSSAGKASDASTATDKDAAAGDSVAQMALDGLLEMAADASPSIDPNDQGGLLESLVSPVGKPALSVVLGRERAMRQADTAALLRYLA